MSNELYDLDYHRAMEAAYERQFNVKTIKVRPEDYDQFQKLCCRLDFTEEQMFHNLICNA